MLKLNKTGQIISVVVVALIMVVLLSLNIKVNEEQVNNIADQITILGCEKADIDCVEEEVKEEDIEVEEKG